MTMPTDNDESNDKSSCQCKGANCICAAYQAVKKIDNSTKGAAYFSSIGGGIISGVVAAQLGASMVVRALAMVGGCGLFAAVTCIACQVTPCICQSCGKKEEDEKKNLFSPQPNMMEQ